LNSITNKINVAFISSYIPRQCGIGTFTNDLAVSVSGIMDEKVSLSSFLIAAINDVNEGYRYPREVKLEIKEKDINDYLEAAQFLNHSDSEVVSLQHEFGLFGGKDGSYITSLISNLRKPLVTTLHTILDNPTPEQLRIIKEIALYSSYLVVLSEKAVEMLKSIYGIPEEKIVHIPHGAPDVPFLDPAYYKDKFQLQDKKVILTFGLLSPGKGITDVINALKEVVRKNPDVTYIILGATHPNIKKLHGEEYREGLERLVKQNGLQDNVIFINRFVDFNQLLEFILMCDIYISPYHNKEQIVSGTLTYAVACGKAVISTPYWYAEELLSGNRGILVPFKDVKAMVKALIRLIDDEKKRNELRRNAYDYGRNIIWNKVASQYVDVFEKSIKEYKTIQVPRTEVRAKKLIGLPDINLNHLKNLTDDTGIIQHAKYIVPNRFEGYCTDDNARALLATVLNKKIVNEKSILPLVNTYFSYLYYAFNEEKGLFRNFMSYSWEWLDDTGSEDSNSRVIYALGYTMKNPPAESYLPLCKTLFDRSIVKMKNFKSPRAIARILIGCIFYLKIFSGATEIKKICRVFAEKLSMMYEENKDQKWHWFEKIVAYSNARMPQAMLAAGAFFNNKKYIHQGLESLNWLIHIQYNKSGSASGGHMSLVGNNGWYRKGKSKALYDQQPVEIPSLISASYQAYCITKDEKWLSVIQICFEWFLGRNDRDEMLYDHSTGGCCDGLSINIRNENQGAESTLSWLISLHRMVAIRNEIEIE
jgi:glycosyltransferase involved in cell wall biosynthesis